MSMLYEWYRSKVDTCRYQLSKSSGEDAWMDGAAFDAHQALEFLLKHIIEEVKGTYKNTHIIAMLYDELAECCDLSFSREDELISLSGMITKWESESRYGNGVAATTRTINRCLSLTECLDKEWLAYKGNINDTDSDKTEKSTIEAATRAMSGE